MLPENSLRLTWIFAIGMRDGLDGAMEGIEMRFGDIKLPEKLRLLATPLEHMFH
jgi:hypothetical protein